MDRGRPRRWGWACRAGAPGQSPPQGTRATAPPPGGEGTGGGVRPRPVGQERRTEAPRRASVDPSVWSCGGHARGAGRARGRGTALDSGDAGAKAPATVGRASRNGVLSIPDDGLAAQARRRPRRGQQVSAHPERCRGARGPPARRQDRAARRHPLGITRKPPEATCEDAAQCRSAHTVVSTSALRLLCLRSTGGRTRVGVPEEHHLRRFQPRERRPHLLCRGRRWEGNSRRVVRRPRPLLPPFYPAFNLLLAGWSVHTQEPAAAARTEVCGRQAVCLTPLRAIPTGLPQQVLRGPPSHLLAQGLLDVRPEAPCRPGTQPSPKPALPADAARTARLPRYR